MKVLDLIKALAISGIVLFAAGCSENEKDKPKSGDRDDNNITIPTAPAAISETDMNRKPTKGGGGNNLAVTDLSDFINTFGKALNIYFYYDTRGVRAADNRPEEYEKEGEVGKGTYTLRDGNGGYVLVTYDENWEYKQTGASPSTETGYQSGTYRFFDFSNSNELFLSGAISYLKTSDTYSDINIGGYTIKANGVINFQGKYRGKVVLDNVTVNVKYENIYYPEHGHYHSENYVYRVTKGSFYVKSDGVSAINLPADLFEDFTPRSDITEYPAGNITIRMPSVPVAPNGSLNNHSGNNTSVNTGNADDFFRVFNGEFSNAGNAPRAVNEWKETWEELKHGKASGYYKEKFEEIGQETNSEDYWSGTGTIEYHDYSDNGRLYIGGGAGSADSGYYSNNNGSYHSGRETIINGTVRFNGEFSGSLVFNNFRYRYNYDERSDNNYNGVYTKVSGSVRIGTLDVTEKYLDYIIRGNAIPLPQLPLPDLGVSSGNDGDTRTINGIECVLVRGGTFTMGSPTNESGRYSDELQHQVTLTQDYWLSKYPITQAQYRNVTGNNPSYFSGRDNNPVESVNWAQANSFAQSVGGRLPTEAEWEFAARGGNKSNGYIYSGSNNLDEVGWYWSNIPSQSSGNIGYGTQPVGQKQPNELGIYDMSGNVYEWCSDWYGSYPTTAVTNPTGPSTGDNRVLRGGYWYSIAQYCRVAYRNDHDPSYGNGGIGFRVVFPRN